MRSLDAMCEQATEAAGLDDLGPDDWRDGATRLIASFESEARLSEIGVVVVETEIVGYLTNRLQLVDWRAKHPAIADADVTPPIFIVGQARTGTTILYDLLAQDPANRVPLSWEVDRPVPAPQTATYETDPRIAEVDEQQAMVDLVIPEFRKMHPMGARLAQECVRMTGSAFRSMIFPTQYRVPSYAQWLLNEADMSPAYAWHRAYLQHLQSEHRGERWVLKSPGHIWCLPAMLAAYPNALLIQTHRDPLRIIASVSSLITLLRRLACDDPTMPEVALEFGDYILDGLDLSVDARESGLVSSGRIADVDFGAFMRDQIGTIAKIYDDLGLELSDEAASRMRRFLDENPQGKHGMHEYTFADTGLDVREYRDRAKRYQEYFNVKSEEL